MSCVKIFHTADLHIGAECSYLGGLAEARRYEVASVFGRMVGFCQKEGVEVCLICGDLFDSNSAAKTFSASVLEYIASAPEVKFMYVAGNHDPLDSSSAFLGATLPSNLYVFGTEYEVKEFPTLNLRVIGRSFAHSSQEACEFTKLLPQDNMINIMLLHADLGADKNSPYNPIGRDFVENSGVDYLALGHIHKRTGISKMGGTYLAYPGCPEGQGFDEDGIKGAYCGLLSKDSCELSFVPLSRRVHRIEKIDISDAASTLDAANIILDKLSAAYGEQFAEQLYKIILTGKLQEDVVINQAELLQMLSDRLYFVKLKNTARKAFDLELLKNENSLKGIFVRKMLEKISLVDDSDKKLYESALYIGLSAFESEVAYIED